MGCGSYFGKTPGKCEFSGRRSAWLPGCGSAARFSTSELLGLLPSQLAYVHFLTLPSIRKGARASGRVPVPGKTPSARPHWHVFRRKRWEGESACPLRGQAWGPGSDPPAQGNRVPGRSRWRHSVKAAWVTAQEPRSPTAIKWHSVTRQLAGVWHHVPPGRRSLPLRTGVPSLGHQAEPSPPVGDPTRRPGTTL